MTNMDEFGRKSLRAFQNHFQEIWNLYNRYGDSIIEIEFEEGEEELKELFKKAKNDSEFQSELIKFWKQHFQIVINSCADIEKAYRIPHKKERIYMCTEEYSTDKDNAVITKEFLDKIGRELYYREEGIVYVLENECVYEIFIATDIAGKYIKIQKKIPIESMLKDE